VPQPAGAGNKARKQQGKAPAGAAVGAAAVLDAPPAAAGAGAAIDEPAWVPPQPASLQAAAAGSDSGSDEDEADAAAAPAAAGPDDSAEGSSEQKQEADIAAGTVPAAGLGVAAAAQALLRLDVYSVLDRFGVPSAVKALLREHHAAGGQLSRDDVDLADVCAMVEQLCDTQLPVQRFQGFLSLLASIAWLLQRDSVPREAVADGSTSATSNGSTKLQLTGRKVVIRMSEVGECSVWLRAARAMSGAHQRGCCAAWPSTALSLLLVSKAGVAVLLHVCACLHLLQALCCAATAPKLARLALWRACPRARSWTAAAGC
jgi:hypothetical protein